MMMRKQCLMLALATIAALLTGCSSEKDNAVTNGGDTQQTQLPDKLALSGKEVGFAQRTNDFSFNMLRQLNGMYAEASLVSSPLSAACALGMLDNAADGEARRQIEETLGFGSSDVQSVNDYFYKLMVLAPQADASTKLSMANAVYVNTPYELLPAFVETLDCYYHADAASLDFSDGASLGIINSWCARQTNGLISEMLKELSPSAASILLNAIYFNGKWAAPFNKEKTRQAAFTTDGGVKRTVPMMSLTTESADYYSDSDLQALRMAYGNGSYSMTVLLPKQGKTVGDIAAKLTPDMWNGLQAGLKTQAVAIDLPRFSVETAGDDMEDLQPVLRQMGIGGIFAQGGLPLMFKHDKNDAEDAFVGKFCQKARIDVTEEGTEGAAVTEVEIAEGEGDEGGSAVPLFIANHPFVYVISERTTGVIFFIGVYRG